jgi:uncharacterized membrane protein HdeD (DUF308 family)
MPMPKITIATGVLLILAGVGGFAAYGSPTALIPAGFGVLLVACGAVALKDNLRKHAMHAAAMLGTVGFLAASPGLFKLPALAAGQAARPAAVVMQSIMAVICLVFVVLCVRSFIEARRQQKI